MRPIPESIVVVVLVGCLVTAVAVAGELGCEGRYKGHKSPPPKELETVLRKHGAWLEAGATPNDKRRADLSQRDLVGAKLQGEVLSWVNLQGAHLWGADLRGACLWGADLRGAVLSGADLQGAVLFGAKLQEAYLDGAKLQGADLGKADLQKAILGGADLRRAVLDGADLQGADLRGADLQGADLTQAKLAGAIYEPNPGKLPNFWTLTDPDENNLETLVFYNSPAALIELREAFKKGGMRTQERQLTYAIEHTRRLQAWKSKSLWEKSESLFKCVAFELPSDYGMSPGRALKILGGLIGLFALVYMVALFAAHGHSGIWMVWLPDRVHKAEGEATPVRVTSTFFFSPLKMWAASRWRRGLARGLSVLLMGLYFSLLSAFSLGWRELNVGTWIARVQPREYVLRATGWVRTVSGIQSLLSVYLLALWVLTYFGRPFE
jgi:hypothetical protein